ncbi:uncharacterized protein LOC131149313 isoform X1 [Malania oleifera]|uniref:uncharacterized protein LOC131149313 isoform X1 n=2 Tax=Malania oleifera TaxID=397392 RepID=UPI0025AE816D|nr:uncharacterized protein LOC131149313 isoform X1 [Malania oleifera]
MARSNKYASVNFNDIYEKKFINTSSKSSSASPSPSPSPSTAATTSVAATHQHKTHLAAVTRTHGRMLVLTRPSPKPRPQPSLPPPSPQQQSQPQPVPDQTRSEPDSISLRPLGRTGAGPSLPLAVPIPERDKEPLPSPKPNRFVPPHLRPGFVGREDKPLTESQKQPGLRSREFGHGPGNFVSPNCYGEEGRPKSSGYEKVRRDGEAHLGEMTQPSSSGNRPSSSGWYGSCRDNVFSY